MTAVLDPPAASWMADARRASPENAEITATVLEVAQAWERQEMTLSAVASLTSGWERFVAINHLARGSADKMLLMLLLDALVPYQEAAPGVDTHQGRFTFEEISEVDGKFDYDGNGERILRFPVRYPVAGRNYDGTTDRMAVYRDIPDHVIAARERER